MSTSASRIPEKRRPIRLKAMQTLVLPQGTSQHWLKIDVQSGVLRLATLKSEAQIEATLALMSPAECGTFRQPRNYQLLIEAVTDVCVEIGQETQPNLDEEDFLSQWLFELYIIRHPSKADERLTALIKLLIERFGKRTTEGFRLEFLLSHHRIAEIIGTTRSTVSRAISRMRSQELIKIDETKNSLTCQLNI